MLYSLNTAILFGISNMLPLKQHLWQNVQISPLCWNAIFWVNFSLFWSIHCYSCLHNRQHDLSLEWASFFFSSRTLWAGSRCCKGWFLAQGQILPMCELRALLKSTTVVVMREGKCYFSTAIKSSNLSFGACTQHRTCLMFLTCWRSINMYCDETN